VKGNFYWFVYRAKKILFFPNWKKKKQLKRILRGMGGQWKNKLVLQDVRPRLFRLYFIVEHIETTKGI
jgi:hypothetical protein